MTTAELLTMFERCPRAAHYARRYERNKLDPGEFLMAGIAAGLTSKRLDFNQAAGEECYQLGATRELHSKEHDIHAQIIHIAALADITSYAIRRPGTPPWQAPKPIQVGEDTLWRSGAFLEPSGAYLRRVVTASSWSDDRQYSICRSWGSLGEVCAYGLPMKIAVVITGQNKGGKYHSWWTHGLRHPANRKLRFRKRNKVAEGFKDTWREVWREDFDDISTKTWIDGMLEDGVFQDCCFVVDLPVPEPDARRGILDLACRKLEQMEKMKEIPDRNMSTCDWPVPCSFRNPCHKGDEPSGRYGFFEIL